MKKFLVLLVLTSQLQAQWLNAYYTNQNGFLNIANIPWNKFQTIVLFAAYPHVTAGAGDGTVDMTNASDASAIIAARPVGKKVLLGLKDNDNFTAAFGTSAAPALQATFVTDISNKVTTNGFDGLDLDWEKSVNTTNYASLIAALRVAMPTLLITMAAGDFQSLQIAASTACPSVALCKLDQVNIMCYDMDGFNGTQNNNTYCSNSNCTWFNDALLQAGDIYKETCDIRVAAFTGAGVPISRIGIGVPYYGRRYTGVTQPQTLGAFNGSTFFYRDLAVDGTRFLTQYMQNDSVHQGTYLSITPSPGPELDVYNGAQAINWAVLWMRAQGFGGMFAFTLDYEYTPTCGSAGADCRYPLSTLLFQEMFGGIPQKAGGKMVQSGKVR